MRVRCPSGKWTISKTFAELEGFAKSLKDYYHDAPNLAKFSTFEPILFGSPDYEKAANAASTFVDELNAVPNIDLFVPYLEFLSYKHGLECLHQLSKARDYKNKHGMTLTHFKMDSGLDLNYALFTKTVSSADEGTTASVLEGWETKSATTARNTAGTPQEPEALAANAPRSPLFKECKEKDVLSLNSPLTDGTTEASLGQPKLMRKSSRASSGGSMENEFVQQFKEGIEHLVNKLPLEDDHKDPLKSPRNEPAQARFVSRESIQQRNQKTQDLQKQSLGVFHKKQLSKNIDCPVTCFEVFSEANLVIAGLENGKIAVFKEVQQEGGYELQLLSKMKVFRTEIKHIGLNHKKGLLYVVGDDKGLAIIDMHSWKILDKHNLSGNISQFHFVEEYQFALVATGQNFLSRVDLTNPKKLNVNQIKFSKSSVAIKTFDVHAEAGLIICSDDTSGTLFALDVEYPFNFTSKVSLLTQAQGFAHCKNLTYWEQRKEVYCGLPGGIVSIHKLQREGDDVSISLLTTVRVANTDLHMMSHFSSSPFLFTASKDGCLSVWSPPTQWLLPYAPAVNHHLLEKTSEPLDIQVEEPLGAQTPPELGTEPQERLYSPANSC